MNVLIFGGTGLLGSAAAQIFIDRGHKVKTIALPPLPEGAPIPKEMDIEFGNFLELTDEELERIITYVPKNANEQLVRTQFLIGAFTGCRHSDYTRLNNRNIVGGMISYVSLKTKTHATVPLKPIVKELLTNLPKEEVTDPTFNNNIRNICRKAGITEAVKVFKAGKEVEGEKWEFVSSHTARRSFATNLYLRGADLYSISQMMGHASVEMTQNYLCCGLREQSAQVMEYFK